MREFLDYLNGLTNRAPLDELLKWQCRLEIGTDELREFMQFDVENYKRNLVKEGPYYRVLVLCWAAGQCSPIHDHAGSTCAVRVIQGVASETIYQQAEHEVLQHTSHWVASDVFGGSDGDIHAVGNFAIDDSPLVTLHVYSPPLVRMGLYSLMDGRLVEQPALIAASNPAPVVAPIAPIVRRHSVASTVPPQTATA